MLFDDGQGGYANRFGALGQQFQGVVPDTERGGGLTLAACQNTCQNEANDAFQCDNQCRPITGPTASPAEARIPDPFGYSGLPFERALFPGRADYNHNFYFTSEVHYRFRYDERTRATLSVLGNDDLWVFINHRLAVDLGGIHVPAQGELIVDAAAGTVNATVRDLRGFPEPTGNAITSAGSVDQFGLVPGSAIEISIFHAQRRRDQSSFQLRLSGFDATRSECTPIP